MFTLKKTLFYCLVFLLFAVVDQGAYAGRLGLNAGFYNESINTPCARSREFGLRLGIYADRTVNDILYASAVRGTNICGGGVCGGGFVQPPPAPCGCGAVQQVAYAPAPCQTAIAQPCGCSPAPTVSVPGYMVPPGCGCSAAAVAPVGCSASYQQPAPKTEIYLLVLPEQRTQPEPAPMMYQPPQPQMQAPPAYYKEPVEYQQPVRGYW